MSQTSGKVFHAILFLACSILFALQAQNCLEKFISGKKTVATWFEENERLALPYIALCPGMKMDSKGQKELLNQYFENDDLIADNGTDFRPIDYSFTRFHLPSKRIAARGVPKSVVGWSHL